MKRHHGGHPRARKHKAGMGKAHGVGAVDKVHKIGTVKRGLKGPGRTPKHIGESAFNKRVTGLEGEHRSKRAPYSKSSFGDDNPRKRARRLEDKLI